MIRFSIFNFFVLSLKNKNVIAADSAAVIFTVSFCMKVIAP